MGPALLPCDYKKVQVRSCFLQAGHPVARHASSAPSPTAPWRTGCRLPEPHSMLGKFFKIKFYMCWAIFWLKIYFLNFLYIYLFRLFQLFS